MLRPPVLATLLRGLRYFVLLSLWPFHTLRKEGGITIYRIQTTKEGQKKTFLE